MRFVLHALWIAACLQVTGVAQELRYEQLLHRLTVPDGLARTAHPDERCVQFSSYDRRSRPGPAAGEAWWANHDRGNYLRIEEKAGRREHVLVDVTGPGVLTRLWSANPAGTLHFDIDGRRVWSVDFKRLCSGEQEGVPAPLAAMRSRGGNVYLPVPFVKRLVVSASEKDLYYLADVWRLPEGRVAESWSPELLGRHDENVRQTAAALREVPQVTGSHSAVAVGGVIQVVPNTLVVLTEVVLQKGRDAANLARQLHGVRLVAKVADRELIDVPLTAFFASRDWRDWQGRLLGIRDGKAYCRWPMPMPRGGTMQLVADRPLDGVELELRVTTQPLRGEDLLFRASYRLVKGQATRPFSDHVVLAARGAGRFVGCSLLVRNPSRIWWGEGDEKFYVDGEAFPSWFGTGTEDYFGYAWCDPTPFHAPFHAQIRCDGPDNFGFTQLHRSHMLDSVPFASSFRFDLERWHWVPDIKIDYETVAYWYGAPDASAEMPAVPNAKERYLPPATPPKTFVARGGLEGEDLAVRSCSGGSHEVQNLAFFEGQFSRDKHRWWRDGKVGDAMVLEVPVATAGTYRVTLAMTRADDFAKVKVSLAGKVLAEAFDGYAQMVSTSGPFAAGTVELTAGTHELRFEIVGKNAKAKNRLMVGLDYLILDKQ